MNKDNLLFVIVGILIGFVSGYLLFEAMATRQPARLVAGQVPPGSAPPGAMGQGAPGGVPAGDPSAGAAGGGPAMAQIEELKNRVAQNPNDAEAVLQLAGMNFQIQNWPRAAELFEQYLKMQPGDPNALTDLGTSYLQAGQVEKSVEVFRQVREQNPGYWQSYFNEIIALATLGRMDEASAIMAELQKIQPDNPDVQRLAAELERRRTGGNPS
ncbi:MAG TPA: tetratricopeptide repeat protein [Thermoanaerobaculia bacterium]|nr:tetratricopeptide repeat protein [Thermoanaerobaculia bacterium]